MSKRYEVEVELLSGTLRRGSKVVRAESPQEAADIVEADVRAGRHEGIRWEPVPHGEVQVVRVSNAD